MDEVSGRWVHRVAFLAAALGLLLSFGLIGAQIYVRWSLNQNFTFLGGNALEVLILASFALIFGLVYLHRARR